MSDRTPGEEEAFEVWGIVELFGHQRIAGLLTERTIAGQGFLQVDVPELAEAAPFTKLIGPKAIYAINPTTPALALAAAARIRAAPVTPYDVDAKYLERPSGGVRSFDPDEE